MEIVEVSEVYILNVKAQKIHLSISFLGGCSQVK